MTVSPTIMSHAEIPKKIQVDALLLPVYEDEPQRSCPECIKDMQKHLKSLIAAGDFVGRHGQTLCIPLQTWCPARIVFVGLGKRSEINAELLRRAGAQAMPVLTSLNIETLAVIAEPAFHDFSADPSQTETPAFYLLEGALLRNYRFQQFQTQKSDNAPNAKTLKSIFIWGERIPTNTELLSVLVEANYFVRDLVLTPANHLTPSALAQAAKKTAGENMHVRVLDRKAIEREGMGAFLAVAQGSHAEPKLIVMEYRAAGGAPIVVVGKGITFDSGGISLKPGEGLEKMKYDMAGGAAVIALMQALGRLKLSCNVVGIVPAAENLPGGRAFRPGDVVTSMSGKTIEIISTDAEGRLILADAITYARKYFRPAALIDIATLTGACSIALGHEAIALMGNAPDLLAGLKLAGESTHERLWEMPLYDELVEQVKGDVADIKNAGGRKGSLIAAGYFLKQFVEDTPWAHLDIAGTAWIDKDKPYFAKGATGVGVRLLVDFFRRKQAPALSALPLTRGIKRRKAGR